MTPEERAAQILVGLEEDYVWSERIEARAAEAIREALEEAAQRLRLLARDYDAARERFPSMARVYEAMRDGALASEMEILSLSKQQASSPEANT